MPTRYVNLLRIFLPLLVLWGLNLRPMPTGVKSALMEARQDASHGLNHLAAVALEKVATAQPWNASYWETIGQYELAANELDSAQKALMAADANGRLSMTGRETLGEVLQRNGELLQAINVWNALIESGNASSEVYVRMADAWHSLGNAGQEEIVLRRWSTLEPGNSKPLYRLAVLLAVNNPSGSLSFMEQAASLNAYYQTDLKILRKGAALRTLSDDMGYQLTVMGRSLGDLGEWKQAKVAFEKAVEANPGYAEAWAFLGEAKNQTGMDGKMELEKALSLNPHSVLALALLAFREGRDANFNAAIAHMKTATELEPTRAAWWIELGSLTAGKGDLQAAQPYFQKAVNVEPSNWAAWQALAQFSLHYHVDVRNVGLPAARKFIELAPTNETAVSLDLMGSVLFYLGDTVSAKRYYLWAIENQPEYASVHLHLGQLYLQEKNYAAQQELSKASALDSTGEIGKAARKLLALYFPEGDTP